MTSAQNDQTTDDRSLEPVEMKHPDLGDVVQVPWYAVEGHEERGYVAVTDADTDTGEQADAELPPPSTPPALPTPTGATLTRATTSGPARASGPDGGQTATPTA